MSIVSVVAGGWSFREVDHHKLPGFVIAVNDSLVYLERKPDCVVSMDRVWTEHRWGAITQAKVLTYLRRSTLKNVDPKPHSFIKTYVNMNDGRPFATDHLWFNGASSGAVALNVAYQMQPNELYMFGFDMCLSPEGDAHWYPQYPWTKKQGSGYDHWPHAFKGYAEQFAEIGTLVHNVSAHSKIDAFRKVTPQELGIQR